MNLTFHIIKKDLRRMSWLIGAWLLATGLAFAKTGAHFPSQWPDFVQVFARFTAGVLILVLIASIVQEDCLVENRVFWRTRPISGTRLLTAKLIQLIGLFVILPVVTGLLWSGAKNGRFDMNADAAQTLGIGVSIALCLTLCWAALASCTKDLGRFFLSLLFCVVVTLFLSFVLQKFSLPAPKQVPWPLQSARLALIGGLCGLSAIGVLLNQYLGRKFAISIGLITLAVIGSAGISVFWSKPIF